jgi:tetratricopeptide (TPR) repeat protein
MKDGEAAVAKGGRVRWLFPLLVLVVGIAAFAQTYRAGFTWDDEWLILTNPRIADPTYIKYMRFGRKLWRPVRRITFMLDYRLYGPKHPEGFHVSNMLMEGAVCLALYFFLLRLTGKRRLSLVTTLLFALHPIHVEAIANISHRKEPLSLLFYLLGFIAYLKAQSEDPPAGLVARLARRLGLLGDEAAVTAIRIEYMVYAFLAYLIGMLSKEVGAVMLPVLIVVWELLRSRGALRNLKRLAPYLGPFVVVLAIFVLKSYLGTLLERFSAEQISWITEARTESYFDVVLIALKAYATGVGLMVWPWPLYLDHAFTLPESLFTLHVLAGLVLVALTVWSVVYTWRRAPLVAFAVCWYALNYLPVSNVVPLTQWLIAERFLYVPSVGFLLLVALGLEQLFEGELPFLGPKASHRAATGIAVALMAVYGVVTVRQNEVWLNSKSLWEHTLKYNDRSYRGLYGYGLEVSKEEGGAEEAERYYRESMEVHPSYPEPYYALGLLLLNEKRYDEAIKYAERYAELDKHDPEPYIVIGNALFFQRDYKGAADAYRKAVERKPEHANALYNLANSLVAAGEPEEALDVINRAIELRDYRPELLNIKVNALERLGRYQEALENVERLLKMDPHSRRACYAKVRILVRLERPEEALELGEHCLKRDPKNTRLRRLLDWIRARLEQQQ